MHAYHPARIALTGGTGALGFAFLRREFQRDPGLQATLLVRRASPSFQSAEFQAWLGANETRLTLLDADIRQISPEALSQLLQADGGLWHFAALTSLAAARDETARAIQEINVAATERLLEAALRQPDPRPFFHISTAYIVGTRRGLAREDEDDLGQSFRNPYEASKLQAELAVRRAFAAGLPGAIFRPSVVVDDASGTGGFKMVDACAYAVALAVQRGEPFVFRFPESASINLVHSDWVIEAMADLARLPSGPGVAYHLTAPRPTFFRDIAAILESRVPNLRLSFAPDLQRSDLPTASKIFDKAVADLRPYFASGIAFDRTQTERDLDPGLRQLPLDLAPFVDRRLQSELAKVAHRKAGPAKTLPG
jgi:nucleoside-diphosphate-sugar epimerase